MFKMMQWIVFFFILVQYGYNCVESQDRVPPGVSPQHYQQSLPSHQGPNMHQIPYDQIPQYQTSEQQLPQQVQPHQYQQLQQPLQVQKIPQVSNTHHTINQQIPEVHMHGYDYGQSHVLNTANIAQEKAHIAEHLDVPMDTSKMSEQELQFHYFKMHDADNNNKLDGCELIKSLIHWHEEGNKDGINKGEKNFKDEELITLIDPILEMDDTNKDGFIDYPEFVQAQQKASSATGHQ